MPKKDTGLNILLISIHGLIRGHDLELGRDADTGGQTKYVVELARALAIHPKVSEVNLLTRLVDDPEVSQDYAQPVESLCDHATIIRLPAGPEGYIRKEELWDHLDNFADNTINYLRLHDYTPHIIHSHYADAGYVGVRLSNLLGIPLVHTGHSLGRVKRRRLVASGLKQDQIESRYYISRRIDAEEETLSTAALVIASTNNEIEEQYALYDVYQPEHMAVVPPGTDLEQFFPPTGDEYQSRIFGEIEHFLKQPAKPMILALSRPDERKNISTLVEAYGESPDLQEIANLVIIAGQRDDIRDLDFGAQGVWTELLILIDCYNLYGRVAYPKQHKADDVPIIYRVAAALGGVFVNPALTEPFGLTLIEAAASSLPIVATEDGGPKDIISNCHNGYLIDPLDKQAISKTLLEILGNPKQWKKLAQSGLKGVQAFYSWQAHADTYLNHLQSVVEPIERPAKPPLIRRPQLYHDRAIIVELDRTLLGEQQALEEFNKMISQRRKDTSFGVATGRGLGSTLQLLKKHQVPMPDVLFVGMGTELYYAPQLTADVAWANHIDNQWNRKRLREILAELPGLQLQPKSEQLKFKLSYYFDMNVAPSMDEILSLLRHEEQNVNVSLSYGQYLDILPARASKGFALRYFADLWHISLENILVAGGTAGDEDMMRGNTLSVAVENPHREELAQLADLQRVYFSQGAYARGILEAIEYYDFFGKCRAPDDD